MSEAHRHTHRAMVDKRSAHEETVIILRSLKLRPFARHRSRSPRRCHPTPRLALLVCTTTARLAAQTPIFSPLQKQRAPAQNSPQVVTRPDVDAQLPATVRTRRRRRCAICCRCRRSLDGGAVGGWVGGWCCTTNVFSVRKKVTSGLFLLIRLICAAPLTIHVWATFSGKQLQGSGTPCVHLAPTLRQYWRHHSSAFPSEPCQAARRGMLGGRRDDSRHRQCHQMGARRRDPRSSGRAHHRQR
jgi:hypothetical protein